MVTDTQLEHLYQRVRLVRGVGDRKRSRLCIMSLVAFLAGELHSDDPAGVSAVVRKFAITINDAMPGYLRQRLKPFAPRLLGTMDEDDAKRVKLLLDAVHREILPRAGADWLCGQDGLTTGQNWRACTIAALSHPRAWLFRVMGNPLWPSDPRSPDNVPVATAQLLAHCAKLTGSGRRDWYWLKAIDILDRLCDVDEVKARSCRNVSPSADAPAALSQSFSPHHDKSWPVAVIDRLLAKVPSLLT